jgi:hypothetical protein
LHKRWCGAVKITHDEKKRELLFKNHTWYIWPKSHDEECNESH